MQGGRCLSCDPHEPLETKIIFFDAAKNDFGPITNICNKGRFNGYSWSNNSLQKPAYSSGLDVVFVAFELVAWPAAWGL